MNNRVRTPIRMRKALLAAMCVLAAVVTTSLLAEARTLDIYFIDVEGGQSTLIVTPAGETLLIDAGFPAAGGFGARPADASYSRDAQRIRAAANDARVQRIDYFLATHYHGDHIGGVKELAQLLPIRTFIDHSAPLAGAEAAVAGTQELYDIYTQVRGYAPHIRRKPGDRLPLKGLEVTVLATEGQVLKSPGFGTGKPNTNCAGSGVPASEKTENPRSTAIRLKYGRFRFLDLGDLSDAPLFALTCPVNLIGETDVYLVTHHGNADAADPAMFKSVNPLVAILNNGPKKGGATETLATLQRLLSVAVWQLHRSLIEGAVNASDERIANLDETTSHWIKLSAREDGSFTVTNGRTGITQQYRR